MPKKPIEVEVSAPESVSYEGKYICLNGMNYGDIRRERGDIVDDIPADSLEWLLEWGHVEPYTGQVLGEPPAIPHVARRVRKQEAEAIEADKTELTIVAAEQAAALTDHSVDADKMVELAEAGDDDIFETSDRVTEDDPVYDNAGIQVIQPSSQQQELAEAGYPIIEPVVVVLEQEESDVREAVIAEIDEQQAGNAAAEGE